MLSLPFVSCRTFVIVPLIVIAGCSASNESTTLPSAEDDAVSVQIVDGTSPSEADQQAMLAAKDALFQKLSGRLMEAMASQGPAAAIQVCQREALELTAEVAEEHKLKIGRTGVRLRNPKNDAPDWAHAFVESKVDTPQFVTLTNGDAAALLPIKLKAQCLMCHGPDESIAPEVKKTLTSLYPDDTATGFREGELRGWFWVEKTPEGS